MFELNKVPFRVLCDAEKAIGKNILSLSQKEDKTFEDLRDFAFVVRYCEDQSYTLEMANELTIEDLQEINAEEEE